jgi:GNAT superfamily N-acetyltransferase
MKHHPQNNGHNVTLAGENFAWKLKVATEADVDPAVKALSDHMNDRQRAVFRDKLQRYVRKSDRELIVAVRGGQTLGLVCVIDQAQFPPSFTEQQASHLRNFASGTQLLVHPFLRRRGIGGSLLTQAEAWARTRGLAGFWIITHRMADWYETNFGYQQIARIELKKEAKAVMAKKFD